MQEDRLEESDRQMEQLDYMARKRCSDLEKDLDISEDLVQIGKE